MNIMKWLSCFLWCTLVAVCGSAQEPPRNEAKVLRIGSTTSVRFASPWVESAVKYSNATELVVMGRARVRVEGLAEEQSVEFPLARVLISTEPRSSYADALKRLEDIAASRPEPARFVEIGGWPAVELEFVEPLPQRGQQSVGAGPPDVLVHGAIIAIAADTQLLRFDISLAPDAPLNLLREARQVARSATFAERPDPEAVQQTIQRMQDAETRRKAERRQPSQGIAPGGGSSDQGSIAPESTGTPVAVQTGPNVLGEIEVAASANARTVVIAGNRGLSFSINRGATFAAGATGVFGLNDPSVARAASGNFYLDVIASPNGTPLQLNVTGCTNAVSRSTNNGANFALRGYSAQCPLTGTGMCFPDQEHLAADARNVTAAGNDQLYAVWRNFTPVGPVANCRGISSGTVTASISCSQNNGVNWTARASIPGGGDYPRVAVGRNGNVYVLSLSGNTILLNRFASCANGLTPATGFPIAVATISGPVACPVPGLDRCNNGNTLSSPTVAPDPANAAHVFVSFAENDGAGGERIVTLESTDSGGNLRMLIRASKLYGPPL